jgi:hypothetical protein
MLYPPTGTLPITLCSQELWLLPSRALLWPRLRLMVLAGLQIGQAVPDEHQVGARTKSVDAQRFLRLIERFQPQRIVVLGPVFRGREHQATGAFKSVLVDWARRTFSGQLDVVRSDVEKSTSSLRRHGPTPRLPQKTTDLHPSRWTNKLQIGPFSFREWCEHGGPDTTAGASFVIAAQRGEGRQAASHTTDHPHFCLLEDCLLLAPFSDKASHAHKAECRGQRAAIIDGKVAWEA